MTTKVKIIVGFAAMVALMAALSFFGYTSLQTASDSFTEYNRLARFNVIASDMMTRMNFGSANIFKFTSTDDEEYLKLAATAYSDVDNLAARAESLIQVSKRKETLDSAVQQTNGLEALMDAVKAELGIVMEQYDEAADPLTDEMDDILWALNESALSARDIYRARLTGTAIRELHKADIQLTGLSQARSTEEYPDALSSIEEVKASIDALSPLLTSDEDLALLEELTEKHALLYAAAKSMVDACESFQDTITRMGDTGNTAAKLIMDLKAGVEEDMNKQGQDTLNSNARGQTALLTVSGGGLVAGILLAFFVIMGIVRVLKELGLFAGTIAAGNFSHTVKIREKGEVGEMVAAMRQIPETLGAVLAQYTALEKRMEHGDLTAQGDHTQFKGDFATLVKGTNNALGRFVTVLDNIPSPVMMMDRELKASYLNTAGRELVGDDYRGKNGQELFAFDDRNSDSGALKRALAAKSVAGGETRAHPRGKTMDVSYSAIPMYDDKGSLASVLQLVTDLTAIKETQRTIAHVASQAADVSNRVAAASEELSAQVEQVSRGAEMQRARVESTASAMTEMNATVLEVARNASQASEQIELTRGKAGDSSELVGKVVHAIKTVNDVSTSMHANMQELGKQVDNIGGVMNVISDIADQTNLLALNAAIEAARAGEAGRGFAVVADEVRKLAEKTMSATSEVGSDINAIQQSAKVNIDSMESASAAVAEATELAGLSGNALGEIVGLASSNAAVVTSIATAAEQQSATSEEINLAINEINQIVGETSDGMVQASSAVQELSQMAQELNRIMDELKQAN